MGTCAFFNMDERLLTTIALRRYKPERKLSKSERLLSHSSLKSIKKHANAQRYDSPVARLQRADAHRYDSPTFLEVLQRADPNFKPIRSASPIVPYEFTDKGLVFDKGYKLPSKQDILDLQRWTKARELKHEMLKQEAMLWQERGRQFNKQARECEKLMRLQEFHKKYDALVDNNKRLRAMIQNLFNANKLLHQQVIEVQQDRVGELTQSSKKRKTM